METRIWFETKLGTVGSQGFATEAEARADIESARNGRPENKFMSEENREYWKSHAEKMVVLKCTLTEETLK